MAKTQIYMHVDQCGFPAAYTVKTGKRVCLTEKNKNRYQTVDYLPEEYVACESKAKIPKPKKRLAQSQIAGLARAREERAQRKAQEDALLAQTNPELLAKRRAAREKARIRRQGGTPRRSMPRVPIPTAADLVGVRLPAVQPITARYPIPTPARQIPIPPPPPPPPNPPVGRPRVPKPGEFPLPQGAGFNYGFNAGPVVVRNRRRGGALF